MPLRLLRPLVLALLFSSSVTYAADARLFQYSTIDALLAGAYDGNISVAELARHGDFGIGTYNRVDGEMILINGVFYKAKGNGKVETVPPQELSPLAIVTYFQPTKEISLAGVATLAELEAQLDASLSNINAFYAIHVQGNFAEMTTRAIDPQKKPYKPLAEVTKTQSVFKLGSTSGQLIGFRSPAFVKGFNVPGYHWHYLSDDVSHGGHVLSLQLTAGKIKIATISTVELQVPDTEGFIHADQSKDRAQELHAVEKIRE